MRTQQKMNNTLENIPAVKKAVGRIVKTRMTKKSCRIVCGKSENGRQLSINRKSREKSTIESVFWNKGT